MHNCALPHLSRGQAARPSTDKTVAATHAPITAALSTSLADPSWASSGLSAVSR